MHTNRIRTDVERALWGLAGGALLLGARRGRSFGRVAAGLGAVACWGQAIRLGRESAEVNVEARATIARPRLEVYRAWRRLEDLPRYFPHLASVEEGSGNRSHWAAAGPAEETLAWEAELTEEWEGEQLCWRSLFGSDLQTEGVFRLRDAPDGRGTEVKLCVSYRSVTDAFASVLRGVTKSEIQDGLRRFKQFVETGEIATTAGQSSGRSESTRALLRVGAPPYAAASRSAG